MSYGLEVYATNGALVASSDYPCLYQIPTPTIVNEFDTTRSGLRIRLLQTNILASQLPPSLFIQMNLGDQVGLYGVEPVTILINGVNTTIWEYQIVGANRGAIGSGYGKFSWYTELPLGSTPAPGNSGFVVRNASNQIMFDSNRNALWMGDFFNHIGPTTVNKGSSAPFYSGLSFPLTQPTPPNAGLPYTNLLVSGTIAGLWSLSGPGTTFCMCPQYRVDGTAIDLTPWRDTGTDFSVGPASISVGQFLTIAADSPT